MKKANIIIADDHPVLRFGLVNIIKQIDNVELIAEAETGQQAIDLLIQHKPQIIILDIEMPVLNGLQVCEWIKQKDLKTKIIILTLFKEKSFYQRAKELGVSGYLLKDYAINELSAAIDAVLNGGTYFSKELQNILVENPNHDISENLIANEINTLSNKEKKILLLISEKKSTKEIALKLFISINTVENHRYNIIKKLKLESGQNNLLKFAVENQKYLK